MKSLSRSRWAAIGAAVAVVLGFGGVASVNAIVSSGERAVFVPISPCRLMDTRPTNAVGPRTAPLGPSETYPVAVHGDNGNCSIPDDAVGIVANVTAVAPTAAGYLTVFPADAARPTASNLNFVAGQAPTPNQVTSDLSSAGSLKIFNFSGNTHVIVDLVGYFVDHNHDDRYHTKAQVTNRIDAATEAAAAEVVITDGISTSIFDFESGTPFSSLSETFTTTKAGRLMVTKSFIGNGNCNAGGSTARGYYLTIDGVAVRSSLIYVTNADTQRAKLSGVTEAVVEPGEHTISIVWECLNNDPGGASSTIISITDVVVLVE